MGKHNDYNNVKRSLARGAGARGTTGINSNGKDAYNQSLKSNKGHYRIEFTRTFEKVSDRDIELRKKYMVDLLSENIAVPADMITLKAKKQTGEQTLTCRDEVFYVKVGDVNYGKASIRTQRLWKSVTLIFIFQKKKSALKPPQKAFSRKVGFKKQTTSQKAEAKRKSYRNRKDGKY
ncbi:hypothetical protein HWC53_gp162 [Bacillus phage vB_BmeM-Goe8]|uniref:Uncharacterized protein n=1 Tax=Bacillus phage vB_BmeM-Goe8 TaxID=2593638 RepID=A0A516KMX3_9CAUD|nr:hypothetical protein HWC53_gp162 [Bacillus phage vB_BmeM-Goe8]QDP42927.1 hypothetical protein Goe8_c01540 [Bacillus phage vB_BmeM-Goe8]